MQVLRHSSCQRWNIHCIGEGIDMMVGNIKVYLYYIIIVHCPKMKMKVKKNRANANFTSQESEIDKLYEIKVSNVR